MGKMTNQIKVTDYDLIAINGRHIRKATKVVFQDGSEIRFTERMPKNAAIAQATALKHAGLSGPSWER
jgi:hypothetical protein